MKTTQMTAALAALAALTLGTAAAAQTPPIATPQAAHSSKQSKPAKPRVNTHEHQELKAALPFLLEAKNRLQHGYKGDEAARNQAIASINQAITICGNAMHGKH